MRYQDDINTAHTMKTVCRAAVAQWTKRLTLNGQTRDQISKRRIFLILQNDIIFASKRKVWVSAFRGRTNEI